MTRTTSKKDMELHYALKAEDVTPVRLNSDVIVHIAKDADLSGKHLIRMYQKNGRAIVDKRWKCKEYTPLMLHPSNICVHDRTTWQTFTYSWGETCEYCPICSPQETETSDPLNVESNLC